MTKQFIFPLIITILSPLANATSHYYDDYAGIKIGSTDFLSQECDSPSCSKDNLAFGLYGGHYFKDWLSVELAYNKLGSAYTSGDKISPNLTATDVHQIDLSPRFDFSLIDNWLFFTKVGVSYFDINTRGSNFSEGKSKWAPSFSVGTEYQVTSDWRLRFEASTSKRLDTQTYKNIDPLFWGVGLTYRPKKSVSLPLTKAIPDPVVQEKKPEPKPEKHVVPYEQRIYFQHSSFKVKNKVLEDLRLKLANGVDSVELIGHTDNTGTKEYNDKFGLKRARYIQNYLVEQGIPKDKITVTSLGETNPATSNDTKEGRALNRFVEIRELLQK